MIVKDICTQFKIHFALLTISLHYVKRIYINMWYKKLNRYKKRCKPSLFLLQPRVALQLSPLHLCYLLSIRKRFWRTSYSTRSCCSNRPLALNSNALVGAPKSPFLLSRGYIGLDIGQTSTTWHIWKNTI